MLFDENALAGDWREEVLHCRDKGVSVNRQIAFAVAVADLLQLPLRVAAYAGCLGGYVRTNPPERSGKPRPPESGGTCRRSRSLGRRRQERSL